jgi:fumarate hydratase subunit beta
MFIVIPPITALLQKRLISKRIVAFQEEGMEAMHELIVDKIPGIVAAANGKSIYNK